MVIFQAIQLPELDKNRVIEQHMTLIFDGSIRYNLILLGTAFLMKSGIDIIYSSGTIEWFDSKLPMQDLLQLNLNIWHIQN